MTELVCARKSIHVYAIVCAHVDAVGCAGTCVYERSHIRVYVCLFACTIARSHFLVCLYGSMEVFLGELDYL